MLVASCADNGMFGKSESVAKGVAVDCNHAVACSGPRSIFSASELLSMRSCSSVEGSLYIRRTNATTLAGLECLTAVHADFEISENYHLESLTGLENLLFVSGSFMIDDNDRLRDLRGLDRFEFAGKLLEITRNSRLGSLDGIDRLTNVGNPHGVLRIGNNNALTSIAALKNFSDEDVSVTIWSNDSLPNLRGLEGIESLVELEISYNISLLSLEGLENLRSVDSLEIDGNEGLFNLRGLEQLQSVGNLFVAWNGIRNLVGLDNESLAIADMRIVDNTLLPQHEVNNFFSRLRQRQPHTVCTSEGNGSCDGVGAVEGYLCLGRILDDFPRCTDADLQSTLVAACDTHQQPIPIQGVFDSTPPQIEVGIVYGVRLINLGGDSDLSEGVGSEGTIAFTIPSTGSYVVYLDAPNIPFGTENLPVCSRDLSEQRIAAMTGGTCEAFRGAYLLPRMDAGTKVSIRLGPVGIQRRVRRLLVLPQTETTHCGQ